MISLGAGMQHAPSSHLNGSMQGNRFAFGGLSPMNGQTPPHYPGQFQHGGHMLNSPHSLPLHPQFNPNMIPDLTSVNLNGGPAMISGMTSQKWPSPQQMAHLGGRGPSQISHYSFHAPVPPGNMMYPPLHQGGLISFPNQATLVHMQSMTPPPPQQQQQFHQMPHQMQHHRGPNGPHPRAGKENGRGGGSGY